jgi:hypothetical protein
LGATVGPLQRLGMSPDGRTILFEVSSHSGLSVELPGPTVYSARDQSAERGRKTNPK